ncbi:hypothetical protein ABW21_db0207846 [Orbilia brochopaga]|nr:hypothetical protein ABW21_db0207846 [Drechslerella brochopaga]
MSTSKTGKHGHAKVHLVAIDIFNGKKLEDLCPSTVCQAKLKCLKVSLLTCLPQQHNMDVPNVRRTEFQLVNIDDGFLNLIDPDGNSKDDVKVPEGSVGEALQSDFDAGKDLNVTILAAMGEEAAIAYKESSGK